MRVKRGVKIFIGSLLLAIDNTIDHLRFLAQELEYRLMKLVYVIETPRVVREAENELHRAGMLQELEHDEDDPWTWDDEEEEPEPEWDDYYDGREWWLRDNDNPGDR